MVSNLISMARFNCLIIGNCRVLIDTKTAIRITLESRVAMAEAMVTAEDTTPMASRPMEVVNWGAGCVILTGRASN